MTSDFHKFPSTAHLTLLPGVSVRGDKVFSAKERDAFLSGAVLVEEKVDGANLGISFNAEGQILAQNRGGYLTPCQGGQWKPLDDWIAVRSSRLFEALGARYVLFGEWCYATHSIFYDQLPDWFVGFDIFDSDKSKFLSSRVKLSFFSEMGICPTPCLGCGHFSLDRIVGFMGRSIFGSVDSEGLYLRKEDSDFVIERAKIVRPGFIQSIDRHWSRQPFRRNRLCLPSG